MTDSLDPLDEAIAKVWIALHHAYRVAYDRDDLERLKALTRLVRTTEEMRDMCSEPRPGIVVKIRRERGTTMRELAEETEMSTPRIQQLEATGRREVTDA